MTSYKNELIAELQTETAATRKMLERVPLVKNEWQPHSRSAKLGNLATHIAEIPGWITMIFEADDFDLAKMDHKSVLPRSAEELIALLDKNVNNAIAAFEHITDEDLDKIWTLRKGDHLIFSQAKKAVIRLMAISHQIHHRGQISVYLRLLDVPVPGMYGPSGDDIAAMAFAAASVN